MRLIARPDLVRLDRASQESGADRARVRLRDGLYTGIWWYARFPNHYAGEGAVAARELGEFEARTWIGAIVQAIRPVRADQESLRLHGGWSRPPWLEQSALESRRHLCGHLCTSVDRLLFGGHPQMGTAVHR